MTLSVRPLLRFNGVTADYIVTGGVPMRSCDEKEFLCGSML
jgi:hypothetical protein